MRPALTPTSSKSRLSNFTSPFRLVRSRSQKKRYDKVEEQTGLLSARRDSDDSDQALLDQDDPASHLLAVLAPLVSGIQRLGPRTTGQNDVAGLFDEVCKTLKALIVELKGEESGGDEHDLEMRSLMLSALVKKVQAERHSITIASPLAAKSLNPFVFHATSLSNASIKPIPFSKPIPVIGKTGGALAPYSSFAGGAPSSTWAMSVIRLGSFQNSMLFSPSPVAVRKLVAGKT